MKLRLAIWVSIGALILAGSTGLASVAAESSPPAGQSKDGAAQQDRDGTVTQTGDKGAGAQSAPGGTATKPGQQPGRSSAARKTPQGGSASPGQTAPDAKSSPRSSLESRVGEPGPEPAPGARSSSGE